MICKRTYTIQELREILRTNMKKDINKKLTAYGYLYTCSGRGEKTLYSIDELPNSPEKELRAYCVLDLGYDPNTSMENIKYFFYAYLDDERFIDDTLEHNRMYIIDHYDKEIKTDTLSKYKKFLKTNKWLSEYEIVCYKNGWNRINTEIISYEEYRRLWGEYWEDKKNDPSIPFDISLPRKRRLYTKNPIHQKRFDEFLDIIERTRNNG